MIGLEAQGLRDLRGASETLTNNSRLFPMWVISVDNFLELDAAGPASVRINTASTSSFRTFRIFTLGPGHQKAEELSSPTSGLAPHTQTQAGSLT